MIRITWSVAVAIMLPLAWASSTWAQPTERVPVLIDTDVGTQIDDAFALSLALGSYELEVRGLTTVGDDTRQRAMLLCRFLTVTGRRHLKVAAGAKPQPSRPITEQSKYFYHPDPLFNRTTKPEEQAAEAFLYERLKQQPNQTTLVALGPLTNIARLLTTHPEAAALIRQIVLLEANLPLDIESARKVFAAHVPLVVVSSSAAQGLELDDAAVQRVFSPGTPLSRQVETLYQMWDQHNPPLGEAAAVALCFDPRLATIESRRLQPDDVGKLSAAQSEKQVQLVTAIQSDQFRRWYVERMASLVAPADQPSRVLVDDKLPHRVHVAEDFETDIERFWWMSGKPENSILPPQSRRACRGVLTHDFDDLLMVSRQMYTAVIFNPVPGPPMDQRTRLRFRYWLQGTDSIRVQLYSLTNGYHRHLVIQNLPQQSWQLATVDMTGARRPDGTGGPLGANERIDDIQFYVDPNAQLVIDDIVLYEAAADTQQQRFPRRIHYTGLFDTGKQGEHWPGKFEIVADAGNFWRAAHAVRNLDTGEPEIVLGLRGQRALGPTTHLSFRYRMTGANQLRVRLVNTATGQSLSADANGLQQDAWSQSTLEFATANLPSIHEIQVTLPPKADFWLDDVLLFEP